MERRFPVLQSPLKVGCLTLRNRVEASATSLQEFDARDYMKPGGIAYYAEKAKGGCAIVTIGETPVHRPTGLSHRHMLALDDPDIVPVLAEISDAIHQHGAIASLQLAHGGAMCNSDFLGGRNPIGPSAMLNPFGDQVEEMDEDLIEFITECFGDAALRLKQCGFDMCQVHAGHGWLLGSFLSPLINKRKDRFGGSHYNRARFTLMVLDCIREKCGPGFPIELRISGTEDFEGGYTLEDGLEFAKIFNDKVDMFNVSVGTVFNPEGRTTASPSPYDKHGMNVYLAEAFKSVVTKPVACLGGITAPELMEEILESGKADVINTARTVIADPFFMKKVNLDKDDEIRPCLRCLGCMDSMLMTPHKLRCAVNPRISRELDYDRLPAPKELKNVLVAGGGPGGMQAAITAAERGHRVVLVEKEGELGGVLRYAKHVPFKEDMRRYCQWLIRMLHRSGAEIRLNTQADAKLLAELKPDVVIAAVGAEPFVPPIPGADGDNVIIAKGMYECGKQIGQKVVIVGGGTVGCETAVHMAMLGKDVEIVEMLEETMPDASPIQRIYIEKAMNAYDIVPRLGLRCTKIDSEGVIAAGRNGKEHFFPADTIVISTGMRPLEALREELRSESREFIPVGDCVRPAKIMDATSSAFAAAMHL